MKTVKLYKDNVYLLTNDATVLKVDHNKILLDRSIFFPEGGGQSSDIGTVCLASNPHIAFDIIHAYENPEGIWHEFVSNDTQTYALKPGDKVICQIEWNHRFDNMQRHCGEHMLSGAIYKLFGGINRGFHMGEHFMTADISLEKDPHFTELTWDMAMKAEKLINSYIWQNLPVTTREFDTAKEALQMPLRKELTIDKDITIVTIGNSEVTADCVACCGTHPNATGQIGLLKIYKVEKNKGMYRIYFDAGNRALEDYRLKHDIITSLGSRYSAGTDDLIEKIEIQERKHQTIKDQLNNIKKQLISLKVSEIQKEIKNGSDFIVKFFDEFTPDDILKIGKPLLPDIKKLLIIADTNSSTMLLFSDGTYDCGKLVKENAHIYSGKGGGKKTNAQVRFSNMESMKLFADLMEKHLR